MVSSNCVTNFFRVAKPAKQNYSSKNHQFGKENILIKKYSITFQPAFKAKSMFFISGKPVSAVISKYTIKQVNKPSQ